jgi:hypothetical protein
VHHSTSSNSSVKVSGGFDLRMLLSMFFSLACIKSLSFSPPEPVAPERIGRMSSWIGCFSDAVGYPHEVDPGFEWNAVIEL